MDVTYLQILGVILIVLGVDGIRKGKIKWSIHNNSGAYVQFGPFHYNLTPDRTIAKGVWRNKIIRPLCAVLVLIGLVLIFIYTGNKVAFTI